MSADPEAVPTIHDADADQAFLPVASGYRTVLRIQFLLMSAPLLIGAFVLDYMVRDAIWSGAPITLAAFLSLGAATVLPGRLYRRLRYRLTDRLLQVVRGWMFHTDTIVPFVRVQHLDIVRGPLDKMFGTATLVVHTAGTHNSIVTLPGLDQERAEAIRDIVRGHIRSDFQ